MVGDDAAIAEVLNRLASRARWRCRDDRTRARPAAVSRRWLRECLAGRAAAGAEPTTMDELEKLYKTGGNAMTIDRKLSATLNTSFPDAVERTRAALSEQGFGVLTEIDVRATLRAKLGVDMEDYLILGACNPPLANRALDTDRRLGLLLPCNVVVRAAADSVLVEAADPRMMASLADAPAIGDVATDATNRLHAAMATLADS